MAISRRQGVKDRKEKKEGKGREIARQTVTCKVPQREKKRKNRSPQGNMWSWLPVALLCMIVNLNEGKEGSGPEGAKGL